jgi:hypothetical protein
MTMMSYGYSLQERTVEIVFYQTENADVALEGILKFLRGLWQRAPACRG